jgi:hypothetical protein
VIEVPVLNNSILSVRCSSLPAQATPAHYCVAGIATFIAAMVIATGTPVVRGVELL